MKRLAFALAIAACKSNEPPPSGSALVAVDVPHLKVVTCEPAELPPRPTVRNAPQTNKANNRAQAPNEHVGDTREWTPFAASLGVAPHYIANAVAIDLYKAIFERASKLDTCFGSHTGSLRAVLRVAFNGAVIAARAGGIGNHEVEACIASHLIGLEVGAPTITSEVTCDLVRGESAPWRLTADAGYRVIDAAHPDDAATTTRDGETTFAIVADKAMPVTAIDKAMTLAIKGSATLVAVRVDAGPPVFVGMGLDGRSDQPPGAPLDAVSIVIDPSGPSPRVCAGGKTIATAPRGKLATLFEAVDLHCKRASCESAVEVALTGTADELVDLVVAARANHVSRLVLTDARCDEISRSRRPPFWATSQYRAG